MCFVNRSFEFILDRRMNQPPLDGKPQGTAEKCFRVTGRERLANIANDDEQAGRGCIHIREVLLLCPQDQAIELAGCRGIAGIYPGVGGGPERTTGPLLRPTDGIVDSNRGPAARQQRREECERSADQHVACQHSRSDPDSHTRAGGAGLLGSTHPTSLPRPRRVGAAGFLADPGEVVVLVLQLVGHRRQL